MAGAVLVGRENQLHALTAVLARQGPEDAALVMGEAGIGKTRLVTAAAEQADETGVSTVWGSCLPLSESLPLLPIVDVIRALAQLCDGDVFDEALQRSPSFVRPVVQRLVSATLRPKRTHHASADRHQLFEAVRQLLVAVSSVRPVAVVVEDIHWADSASIDVLEYLLAHGLASDVPVVMTFRTFPVQPDGSAADQFVAQSLRRPGVLRLTLDALNRDETLRQVAGLTAGAVNEEAAEAIYHRCDGNPFFAEQLLAAITERADGSPTPTPLPAQFSALLVGRLDRLDPSARQLAEVMAVASRPLHEQDLLEVCGSGTSVVRSGLRSLVRHGLATHDQSGYRLRHALLGEAISDSLLEGERAELHTRIGQWIAHHGDPTHAAQAAEHLARAGLGEQELGMRIRAAEYAHTVSAWSDETRHWLRALELYGPTVPRPGDRELAWRIYGGLDSAVWELGSGEQLVRYAREAHDRLLKQSSVDQEAELQQRLGRALRYVDPDAAIRHIDRSLALVREAPASAVKLTNLRAKQLIVRRLGRNHEADQLLNEAIQVARELCDYESVANLMGHQAWALAAQGDEQAALAKVREIDAVVEGAASPRVAVDAGAPVTDMLMKTGRLSEAVQRSRHYLQVAQDNGLSEWFASLLIRHNAFLSVCELGDITQAAGFVAAIELSERASPHVMHESAAHLALLQGDLAASHARWLHLDQRWAAALHNLLEVGDLRLEVELWREAPPLALAHSEPLLARAAGSEASAAAGPVLVAAARAAADWCNVAAVKGDEVEARDSLARLVDLHRQMPIDPLSPGPMRATAEALRLAWIAEQARAEGEDSSEQWEAVATAWMSHSRPHRAAYARWRQAQTLVRRPGHVREAHAVLQRAADEAVGHVPLHAAIAETAHRAGLRLSAADGSKASPGAEVVAYQLTAREVEVLRLVAEGLSNGQIGARLYMSPKTASVHVSHILAKLGVATRAHAAATASLAGLLDAPLNRPGTPRGS